MIRVGKVSGLTPDIGLVLLLTLRITSCNASFGSVALKGSVLEDQGV